MSDDRTDLPQPPHEDLRVRRVANRVAYDRQTVDAIADAALVAHVGTVRDGKPLVIPMLCVRDGDWLLLHGSPASGTMRRGRDEEVCVTLTLLDGLVLARSAFHHSMNYRSLVVLGRAELISDDEERSRALDVFMERLVPGRGAQLRPMTTSELRQTAVLRIPLDKASTKIRSGPPVDEDEDYDWPAWAGVLPVSTMIGQPIPDPRLKPGIETPRNIRNLAESAR